MIEAAVDVDPDAVDRHRPAGEAERGLRVRQRHAGALGAVAAEGALILGKPLEQVEIRCPHRSHPLDRTTAVADGKWAERPISRSEDGEPRNVNGPVENRAVGGNAVGS